MLIKYILEPSLKKCKGYKKIKAHLILSVWDKSVGEKIRSISSAVFFKNNILFVEVKNSSWLYELTCLKAEIIKNLNKNLKKDFITDIRFSIARIKSSAFPEKAGGEAAPAKKEIILSKDDLAQIEETVKNLTDEKLKNTVRKILIQEKKRNIEKKEDGYKDCSVCGVLTKNSDMICDFCYLKKYDREEKEVAGILSGKPWLTYNQINAALPHISNRMFYLIKTNLIEKYQNKITAFAKKKKLTPEEINTLINLVLLKSEKLLEEIDFDTCKNVLNRTLVKHLEPIFEEKP
ncbi:MAG: DUF721 domain-containing protein [Armatimonadota bacterium]